VQEHGTTNSPKHYEFADYELRDVESVDYRLKQIDNDGTFAYSKTITVELTSITSVEDEELPTVYSLEQNYPDPFNPTTTIKFAIPQDVKRQTRDGLPASGAVRLVVYDILGREVATLVNEVKQPGMYKVEWNASSSGIASGVYYYRITAGSFSDTKKLMIIK
jgi:hypothetical protein